MGRIKGGQDRSDGHWILKPYEGGWRLTYNFMSNSGERISHGAPIDGDDPKMGVEMMTGLIHQEILDVHKDIADKALWLQTQDHRAYNLVVDKNKTLGEWLTIQIQEWHNIIPQMVRDYHHVVVHLADVGWPLIVPEPFPWIDDPSLIPHRNEVFQRVHDALTQKNKSRKDKANKARAKRKKAKRNKR